MPEVDLTTVHLEMTSPEQLRPKRVELDGLEVRQVELPSPEFSRFLYVLVGREFDWTDRLPHDRETWLSYLDRPELETWAMYVRGTPAGYYELERQPGNDFEIRSFGVAPYFVGRGLGGHLLTHAVERGWANGARRVWLHTCTHDHPHALNNYLARGFREFYREVTKRRLPDPRPWHA